MSLNEAHAEARLPVRDLDLARRWYADKLDLHPVGARPGHLIYRLAVGTFCLFTSAGASQGTFSQLALQITDIHAEVARLGAAGVVFEHYPAYAMKGPIAEITDPDTHEIVDRVAWFHDTDRNLISVYELQQ